MLRYVFNKFSLFYASVQTFPPLHFCLFFLAGCVAKNTSQSVTCGLTNNPLLTDISTTKCWPNKTICISLISLAYWSPCVVFPAPPYWAWATTDLTWPYPADTWQSFLTASTFLTEPSQVIHRFPLPLIVSTNRRLKHWHHTDLFLMSQTEFSAHFCYISFLGYQYFVSWYSICHYLLLYLWRSWTLSHS